MGRGGREEVGREEVGRWGREEVGREEVGREGGVGREEMGERATSNSVDTQLRMYMYGDHARVGWE